MLNKTLEFILGKEVLSAVRDPHSDDYSSTRIAGLACVFATIVYIFTCTADATVVAALIGGGAVSFLTRSKSTPENADSSE
jgi:hypothetical protein